MLCGKDGVVLPGDTREVAVGLEALDCSNTVGKASHYTISAKFSKLQVLRENCQLYTLEKEEQSDWPNVKRCQLEIGMPSLVLWEMHLRVMEVPGLTHLQSPTAQVMELDDN